MKIEKININNIPIITYEKDDNSIKPLIFFFHGFTGNKENLMGRGEKLAELGFFVVAMDAYLHGERMDEWFKILPNEIKYQYIIDIAIQTSHDAKYLWENIYKNNKNIKSDRFYTYGVSMGSMISYSLATITNELEGMVTLVGSPSFVEYYLERQARYNWSDEIVKDRLLKYQELDPLLHPNKINDNVKLFIALGKNDEVVYPTYSRKLYKLRKENTILKEYDTGHVSTDEMLSDSYEFLKQFI